VSSGSVHHARLRARLRRQGPGGRLIGLFTIFPLPLLHDVWHTPIVVCVECLPADKPWDCGVCDTPELWRGAADAVCACTRVCWCRRMFTYIYILHHLHLHPTFYIPHTCIWSGRCVWPHNLFSRRGEKRGVIYSGIQQIQLDTARHVRRYS